MYQFGVGYLFGNPVGGNQASPNGPVFFGTVQDVSVDITRQNVALRGQSQGPDDVASGNMDVKVKATFAKIEVSTYNRLFFGQTMTTGIKVGTTNESHTASTSVQVSNHVGFNTDLGVVKADGTPYSKVGSGQEVSGVSYSVTVGTGTYAFANGDANTVLISYAWTNNVGNTLSITNQQMGYGPAFEMWLTEPYQGTDGLHLWLCKSNKLSLPFKRDNYTIQDVEAESYPNSSSQWLEFFQVSA